tara:strand:- start:112 stop:501 length:390 start_codon:yes stop_codon:yes gene_type:complete
MKNETKRNELRVVLSSGVRQGFCHEGIPQEQTYYFVEAATAYGYVFMHDKAFESYELDAAQKFADVVAAKLDGTNAESLDERYWLQRGNHVYGSEAYQAEGGEQELQRFCVEAYEGPGAYTPAHPEYIG